MKIKCSKCEFFKSKVHYLGFLVGADSIQPLLEKMAAIEALEPPQNIEELWHFLGFIRFYRKFILFFTDVNACLNTMLRKGAVFKWTEQCNNVFNLLKSGLVKMPRLQYPNPNKTFKLFTNASKHSYSGILHQKEASHKVNTGPKLVPIAYFPTHLVKCSNCGTPPRKSVRQFIGLFKSFHSIWQKLNSSYTVTTYHWHHFTLGAFPVWYLTAGH